MRVSFVIILWETLWGKNLESKVFGKGVRGDSLQCREMSAGQRVAGAVGAEPFLKKVFPQ